LLAETAPLKNQPPKLLPSPHLRRGLVFHSPLVARSAP
jgi:hypothetical protein